MNDCILTFEKLDVGTIYNKVEDESCGATSLFIGTTRDTFDGKVVTQLEYEAYEPMAKTALMQLANELRSKYGVVNIAIHHRLGIVPVKEASVVIAVSSPHRKASLDAVSYAIETLKASVPIFKKEIYSDNSGIWKSNNECEILFEEMEVSTESQDLISTSSDNLVQITANAQEINRRIAAFMKRKREEINMQNLQDFSFHGAKIVDREFSCARVDAVLIRNKNSKSHLKVSRVHNVLGPQIEDNKPDSRQETVRSTSSSYAKICPEGAKERINNAEKFLGLYNPSEDVFVRLKAIEERILFLESVSPEYFQNLSDLPSNHIKSTQCTQNTDKKISKII